MTGNGRLRGNQYRATEVCIDSYHDGVLVGQLSNLADSAPRPFRSATQFLTQMEDLLDQMQFPQAFQTIRSFAQPPSELPDALEGCAPPQMGGLATFVVRILFRQNASWQGTVTWMETGQEENFRSVLELLLLMDSALKSVLTNE